MKRETRNFNLGVTHQLKEKLKARAREDKQKKLEMCWNLLLNLYKNGCQDFSKASFGKALESAGIMKHQSFKNTTGKDYQELLHSFANEAGVPFEKPRNRNEKDYLNRIVDEIADLDDQARLRFAVAELAFFRTENITLRNEMSQMQRVSYGGSTGNKARPATTPSVERTVSKTSSLKRFLEDDWMSVHGLTIRDDGSVACDGQVITLPGFVQQLSGLIGNDFPTGQALKTLLNYDPVSADLQSIAYEKA